MVDYQNLMKSKKIYELLKKNKIGTESFDPPKKFEITPQNALVDKTQSELGEDSYYEMPDMNANISAISKKITRNRKHYLNQLEKSSREEAIQQMTKKRKAQIENSFNRPDNIQDIIDLIKKRHEWKSALFMYDNTLPKICKVETCSNYCISGSDFCLSHISKDPSNNLFIECPKCHRIHPINSHCPI